MTLYKVSKTTPVKLIKHQQRVLPCFEKVIVIHNQLLQ